MGVKLKSIDVYTAKMKANDLKLPIFANKTHAVNILLTPTAVSLRVRVEPIQIFETHEYLHE